MEKPLFSQYTSVKKQTLSNTDVDNIGKGIFLNYLVNLECSAINILVRKVKIYKPLSLFYLE